MQYQTKLSLMFEASGSCEIEVPKPSTYTWVYCTVNSALSAEPTRVPSTAEPTLMESVGSRRMQSFHGVSLVLTGSGNMSVDSRSETCSAPSCVPTFHPWSAHLLVRRDTVIQPTPTSPRPRSEDQMAKTCSETGATNIRCTAIVKRPQGLGEHRIKTDSPSRSSRNPKGFRMDGLRPPRSSPTGAASELTKCTTAPPRPSTSQLREPWLCLIDVTTTKSGPA